MAWVKIDDGFADHPKIAAAGPLGMALQVAALCYCNRFLTDGFIPQSVALRLIQFEGLAEPEEVIQRLITAGVWDEAEGGYLIHDYLEYQPSREEIETLRNKRKEAGRIGGLAKSKQKASKMLSKSSSKKEAKLCPVPVPDPVPIPEPGEEDPPQTPPVDSDIVSALEDGLQCNVTPAQLDELDDATNGLDKPLILHAIEITAQQRDNKKLTGSAFRYMLKILQNWRQNEIYTLDDLRQREAENRARGHPKKRESATDRILREAGIL